MASYLLLGDLHLTDKAPSSCTDSYCDDLFDLLGQVNALVREHEAIAVVIAGDVFHNKAPSRTSHRVVRRFIRWCQSIRVPVFIVPGNHDIRNDRHESIEDQPLGVVFESGAASRLEGWGGYDADHQYMVYGVPWQQDWSTLSPALSNYRHPSAATQPSLVVAHAPLYPPGKELSFEFYPSADWAKYMGGQGYVYYGHVHEPHAVWENGGVTFANFGALSRGSLHEYNLTRAVGVGIWDDRTGAFGFIPLRAKPAPEVFRLTEKQQVTDMHGRLDSFLDEIGSTELGVVTAEGVLQEVRQMGLKPGEVAMVEELLAEVHHDQEGRRG